MIAAVVNEVRLSDANVARPHKRVVVHASRFVGGTQARRAIHEPEGDVISAFSGASDFLSGLLATTSGRGGAVSGLLVAPASGVAWSLTVVAERLVGPVRTVNLCEATSQETTKTCRLGDKQKNVHNKTYLCDH